MKEIQITLYDVFGYLIPGVISLVSIAILVGTLFLEGAIDIPTYPAFVWIALAVIAYITGHMTQAIATALLTLLPSTIHRTLTLRTKFSLEKEVLQRVNEKARRIAGIEGAATLNSGTVFEICDHYVQQHCKTDARDIYVYREGFYRGISVALLCFGVALLIRLPLEMSEVRWAELRLSLSRSQVTALILVSFSGAWLMYQRYRRFGNYLVKFAVYGVLVSKDEEARE
jgi:hypothetical protein